MGFFYGVLATIGWIWFAIVIAYLEREMYKTHMSNRRGFAVELPRKNNGNE